MARFDPLTQTLNEPSEVPKKRRRAKARHPAATTPASTELSRKIATLPTGMFRAMAGSDGSKARTAFAAWCATRPELTEWRAAWRNFEAETRSAEVAMAPKNDVPPPQNAPSNIIRLPDQRQTAAERALAAIAKL